MLKVLETTSNQLIFKEERSILDARMLAIFNYNASYFLLTLVLKRWSSFDEKNSLLKFMYDIMTYPPFVYFNVIGLALSTSALLYMLEFGSWLPTRTFTFDRKSNLLIIKYKCLFWHRKVGIFSQSNSIASMVPAASLRTDDGGKLSILETHWEKTKWQNTSNTDPPYRTSRN